MTMRASSVATAEQIRELDRIAIDECAIPGLILMENAGRACAEAAREALGDAEGKRVDVFCGRGNNGGDGFVVARHLANWGAEVHGYLLAKIEDVSGGDAAVNLHVALNMGIPVTELPCRRDVLDAGDEWRRCDLVVDALLGTGVSGEVREPFRSAIERINGVGRPVLAVDVPSGLDCDTGEPLGLAVRADRTVTFAVNKVGFTRPQAQAYTGKVTVAEISIPRFVIERQLAETAPEGD